MDMQNYWADRRMACRYGERCYQTNENHHRQFKHPPKRPNFRNDRQDFRRDNKYQINKRKTPTSDLEALDSKPKIAKKDDIENKEEIKDTSEVTDNKEDNKKDTKEEKKEDNTDDKKEDTKDEDLKDNKKDEVEQNNIKSNEKGPEEELKKSEIDEKEENNKIETNSKEVIPCKGIELIDEKVKEVTKSEEVDKIEQNEEVDKSVESTEAEECKKDTNNEQLHIQTEKEETNDTITEMIETENTKDEPESLEASAKLTKPFSEYQTELYEILKFKMPNDFFYFYNFCQELNSKDPKNALKQVNIQLVGPYDLLISSNIQKVAEKCDFLTHWRYFYDTPEFQTIIRCIDNEGLHYGYWRDTPNEIPVFVASNRANVSCKIKSEAENLFGAMDSYLEEKLKKANPFDKTKISNVSTKMKAFAKKHNITLGKNSDKMRLRERKVLSRTFHGAGIVAPYNKKTQLGYRELSVSDTELRKILDNIDKSETDEEEKAPRSQLGEVIRLATIAGDECDFGTCLELGHDLFSSGFTKVQDAALGMLGIAYSELERTIFLKIAQAHMKNRKKECDETLSALKTE